jgi:hypothetical protein
MSSIPRRAVLTGALLPLVGNLPSPPATAVEATSATLDAMRRLLRDYRAAEERMCDLDGTPGYDQGLR